MTLLHVVCPLPQSKILATLMAHHAHVEEKGSNFSDPVKETLFPLEQRSSCGTGPN